MLGNTGVSKHINSIIRFDAITPYYTLLIQRSGKSPCYGGFYHHFYHPFPSGHFPREIARGDEKVDIVNPMYPLHNIDTPTINQKTSTYISRIKNTHTHSTVFFPLEATKQHEQHEAQSGLGFANVVMHRQIAARHRSGAVKCLGAP